jgi:hypothetical protein
MKRMLLLLPAVLAVLLMSGCVSQDPDQLIKDSLEKLNGLDSYQIDYDYSVSMSIISMSGKTTIYKEGEKTRLDMDLSMLGADTMISIYSLPEGVFTCTELMGNATCVPGDGQDASISNPDKSVETLGKMIEMGVIKTKYLNAGMVAGRSCHNISSEFDLQELGKLAEEELQGMGIDVPGLGGLDNIKSMKSVDCYDAQTGMPLRTTVIVEIVYQAGYTDVVSMVTDLAATSFSPGVEMADSVFELPAEPTELPVPENATTPGNELPEGWENWTDQELEDYLDSLGI